MIYIVTKIQCPFYIMCFTYIHRCKQHLFINNVIRVFIYVWLEIHTYFMIIISPYKNLWDNNLLNIMLSILFSSKRLFVSYYLPPVRCVLSFEQHSLEVNQCTPTTHAIKQTYFLVTCCTAGASNAADHINRTTTKLSGNENPQIVRVRLFSVDPVAWSRIAHSWSYLCFNYDITWLFVFLFRSKCTYCGGDIEDNYPTGT